MKDWKHLLVLIVLILTSCHEYVDSKKLARYEQHFREFKKADYSFSGYYNYHRFRDFDLESFTDTILKCHEEIFTDKAMLRALKKDLSAWLHDSVFIAHLQTPAGTMVVDTTNMLPMDSDEELRYYTQEPIRKGQELDGQLFETDRSMHSFRWKGKTLYYDLVPANPEFAWEVGEYRIETTGKFIPRHMHVGGKATLSNLRYLCDAFVMDWFLTIRSDDFFEHRENLAIRFSGESYHYMEEMGRRDKEIKKRNYQTK